MKANMKSATLVLIISLKAIFINAQLSKSYYELGGGIGAYVYQGDLTPSRIGSFKTMKPGLILSATKVISASRSYRVNITIASLKGDESKYSNPEYRQQRNFKFKTPLIELSGFSVWDVRGNNFYRTKGTFSPYVYTGVGLSFLKIQPDRSGFNEAYFNTNEDILKGLTTDSEKNLPRILPFVPVGLGFRYELSERIAINTETAYRFVFTDYLDGFSYSANPEKNDHYLSQTFGIIFKLGKKNSWNCPKVKF